MSLPSLDYIINNNFNYLYQKSASIALTNLLTFYFQAARSCWELAGTSIPVGQSPPDYTGNNNFICDSSTAGAMLSGCDSTLYLNSFKPNKVNNTASSICYLLVDRLWAASGFSLNTTGEQNIPFFGTLPNRDLYGSSSGFGVDIFIRPSVTFGNVNGTINVNYLDAYDNPKTGTFPKGASLISNLTIFPFGIDSSSGIKSITSVKFNSTGTGVGRFDLVIGRTIHMTSEERVTNKSLPINEDVLKTCLPIIYPSSCLFLITSASASSTMGMPISCILGFNS